MLTSGDVEFEPETPKIYPISNSIAVMIAGDSSLQALIIQRLQQFIRDRVNERPNEWVPVEDAANEYLSTYQKIKAVRAEGRVLAPLGLTLDTFVQRQNQMLPSFVADITREVLNFQMPPIGAIVAGIDATGTHLHLVTNDEVSCRDAVGFAAIGIGYWHANSQFTFAGHNAGKPLPETMLLTYAAKRRAEVAPGVGEGTDMFSIGPALGSYVAVRPDVVADLDKIYERTRKRANESVSIANKEVTEYVEDLGKAAASRQEAAPEQPTTGSDGEKSAAAG